MMQRYTLSLIAIAISIPAYAGFGLETTRVIYQEKDKNQSVVAFNTDQDTNYLLQSWVENNQEQLSPDFVTTPPLLKLRPQQKNTIQITKNSNQSNTTEQLYWLNVKFIAPSDKNLENVLKYSMTHRIKLIYRPSELSVFELAEEVKKIKWQMHDGALYAENPTAFFINIAALKINATDLEAPSYFPPYSKTQLPIQLIPASQKSIQLTYINDYGKAVIETF
ncbi:fimbrial chaperone protein [Acinetobacter calcoaceticus]|uniref:Fimbrial chaperone protein n=1 Tax=Acinetobacter calcoaceticus TaxID=471 RepID=A0A4R1XM46_ACICA|nr:fimbrial chaperone protein [Acinetobacter calcoaceticus]